jgi:hypothetical protein
VKYITGLLLLVSTSLVVAADKVKKIPYEIPIGPAYLYFDDAPDVIYCTFLIQDRIRQNINQRKLPQDAFNSTALVKIGKDKTTFQQGEFEYELKTLVGSKQIIHAASMTTMGVRDFYAQLEMGYALFTETAFGDVSVYRGNCSSFKE